MHTLVVSGLHVGYVVAVFWFLLRWLPVGSVWLTIGDGSQFCRFLRSKCLQKNSSTNSVNGKGGASIFRREGWLTVGPMGFRWLLLILPLGIYCLVIGAAPPVMRATLIVIVFILCFLLGRDKVVYHAFAFACLIILLLDPQALFGASFQLSFAACLGIVYISPKLINMTRKYFAPDVASDVKSHKSSRDLVKKLLWPVLNLFFVSISAQFGTAPLLAKYFYKLSVVSLISNLIVVPTIGVVLWLCFGLFFSVLVSDFVSGVLHVIATTWSSCEMSPTLAGVAISSTLNYAADLVTCLLSKVVKLSAWLCYISSHWLIKTVEFFASQPGAIVRTGEPSTLFIAVYYVFLIVIFKLKKNFHRLLLLTIALIVFILTYSLPRLLTHSLSVTFLDVGLGDAIFVKAPSGENIFIDCGGDNLDVGRWVYEPFLWRAGITTIDKILITTNKWTHFSGLK
ncbi:MAG: ComEC/Rec2 family competence protein, partial [Elusimicrobiota bacterium]|nr:ComEC/Rec2 family competence protein [Elusimicrobiota bacterium]